MNRTPYTMKSLYELTAIALVSTQAVLIDVNGNVMLDGEMNDWVPFDKAKVIISSDPSLWIHNHHYICESLSMGIISLCEVPSKQMTQYVCKVAVAANPLEIQYVPKELQDHRMCEMASIENPDVLMHIRDDLKTYDMCFRACKSSIAYIPTSLLTPDIYIESIIEEPSRFLSVPKGYMSYNLCCSVVEVHWDLYAYIPIEYIDKHITEIAVRRCGLALKHVPKELITKDLCNLALTSDPHALKFVPQEFKTEEMYKLAVSICPSLLPRIKPITHSICVAAAESEHVSLKFIKNKTKEICELAMKSCPANFSSVPDMFITPWMCEIAVRYNGHYIDHIPLRYINNNIIRLARIIPRKVWMSYDLLLELVSNNGNLIECVPNDRITKELCIAALRSNGMVLRYILTLDSIIVDKTMYHTAASSAPSVIRYVPKRFMTYNLCLKAIAYDGQSIECIKEEYKTYDMFLAAASSGVQCIDLIPTKYRTFHLYNVMVKASALSLRIVPWRMRTKRMCLDALELDRYAMKFVPPELLYNQTCYI